jgi:hypothetical protein
MPRKSRVRRNQRSKRVQRNRNRNTKRLTKRGRRTNVRKNSKKVNSKRRKRRKTRKTRQNVIMKGGLWPSTTSLALLQPADQQPVYYDLFAREGTAVISKHDVREQSYPGRTGKTPGLKLFTDLVQIPNVGRLAKGTKVWYRDRNDTLRAEIDSHGQDDRGNDSVLLRITEKNLRETDLSRAEQQQRTKWAYPSHIHAPNTEFTTTMCGDQYLAFLPPDRPEVPLYLKVLDLTSREEIWIYFLSKWVKSAWKTRQTKGASRRRMFLLRPSQGRAWSGCGSGNKAARLQDRALQKYVDRKIKGIHWDPEERNRTVTVSYEDRERGPVNDVFRLLPQRKVKISGYLEEDKPVSDTLPQTRKSGPEVFEEGEDQDWEAFKRNLTGLWTEYESAADPPVLTPKGVRTPAGTRAAPVVGTALSKPVMASAVTHGVLAGSPSGTVMAEAVPPGRDMPTGGATGF